MEKRVDGLELNMQQTGLDECGQTRAVLVHATLQRIEAGIHLGRRWWHEHRQRVASIIDLLIRAGIQLFRWRQGKQPDNYSGLSGVVF